MWQERVGLLGGEAVEGFGGLGASVLQGELDLARDLFLLLGRDNLDNLLDLTVLKLAPRNDNLAHGIVSADAVPVPDLNQDLAARLGNFEEELLEPLGVQGLVDDVAAAGLQSKKGEPARQS